MGLKIEYSIMTQDLVRFKFSDFSYMEDSLNLDSLNDGEHE